MATHSSYFERKRFFAENEDGDKFPIVFTKSSVIITTKWKDRVVFSKSNRGKYFNDSRTKKLISESEVRSEIARLLDTKEDADKALGSLGLDPS